MCSRSWFDYHVLANKTRYTAHGRGKQIMIPILEDMKLLLRQFVAALLIMFLGVILFVVLALALSTIIPDKNQIILQSLLLTTPVVITAHIILYRRKYHLS